MQERFNKELEEIKKSQSIMSNAIDEIKNTLQGTNSGITEAEEHPKTHINQINKAQTQRTKLKAAREKQQITHKGIPIRITADLSRNSSSQKGMARHTQ